MALRTKRAWVALITFVLAWSACATPFWEDTHSKDSRNDDASALWAERRADDLGRAPLSDTVATSQSSTRLSYNSGNSGNSGNTGNSDDSDEDAAPVNWVEYARQTRDLTPGMTMGQVRSTWGEPTNADIAGDPRLGHQRWTYVMGTASQLSSQRVIYFESGRVVGWESH